MESKSDAITQFIEDFCRTDARSCNIGVYPKVLYAIYKQACPVHLQLRYPVWLPEMKSRFATKWVHHRLVLMVGLKEGL